MPYITMYSVEGPYYYPNGRYWHAITWDTDALDGVIVQHIERSDVWMNNSGGAGNVREDYWEAWRIHDKVVVPQKVIEGKVVNNIFSIGDHGPNSKGEWSIKGTIYYFSEKDFTFTNWTKDNANKVSGGRLYVRQTSPSKRKLGCPKLIRNEAGEWCSIPGQEVQHRWRSHS